MWLILGWNKPFDESLSRLSADVSGDLRHLYLAVTNKNLHLYCIDLCENTWQIKFKWLKHLRIFNYLCNRLMQSPKLCKSIWTVLNNVTGYYDFLVCSHFISQECCWYNKRHTHTYNRKHWDDEVHSIKASNSITHFHSKEVWWSITSI